MLEYYKVEIVGRKIRHYYSLQFPQGYRNDKERESPTSFASSWVEVSSLCSWEASGMIVDWGVCEALS